MLTVSQIKWVLSRQIQICSFPGLWYFYFNAVMCCWSILCCLITQLLWKSESYWLHSDHKHCFFLLFGTAWSYIKSKQINYQFLTVLSCNCGFNRLFCLPNTKLFTLEQHVLWKASVIICKYLIAYSYPILSFCYWLECVDCQAWPVNFMISLYRTSEISGIRKKKKACIVQETNHKIENVDWIVSLPP